jgi:hypothetical protein
LDFRPVAEEADGADAGAHFRMKSWVSRHGTGSLQAKAESHNYGRRKEECKKE